MDTLTPSERSARMALVRCLRPFFLTHIQLMVEFPEIRRRKNEDLTDHRRRILRYMTFARQSGLRHTAVPTVAKYGVPGGSRSGFLFFGFRSNIKADWSLLEETHL